MFRTLAVLTVLLASVSAVSAAEPAKGAKKAGKGAALFAKADTNNDGVLSKAEFEKFMATVKAKGKVKGAK